MIALLATLAIAACASLWLSNLPGGVCMIGSAAAVAYAVWLLRREARRNPCLLTRMAGDADWQVECDGRTESFRHVGATLRGGLAVLTVADDSGGLHRHVWWPDTLDAAGRRELRLAAAPASGNETARADA